MRTSLLLLTFCYLACEPAVCQTAANGKATFLVEIENTWSELTHPGAFPNEAHFSWVAGSTHQTAGAFWNVGDVASPGMVQMAETGVTAKLLAEIAKTPSDSLTIIDQDHWFCPAEISAPSCGQTSFELQTQTDFPLLSLVTMLGPSPDWFVGVSSLPFRDSSGWIQEQVVELFPYDGGTRDANAFALYGDETTPPAPVSLISEASGQLITPRSLGTLTIRLLQPCDLSGDFVCDTTDINLLTSVLANGGQQYDLNQDGATNSADRTYWIEDLLNTQPGDQNLDGVVTFPDFLVLARNYGTPGNWEDGDFDGDGMVGFTDFIQLSTNYGGTQTDVSTVSVPEASTNLQTWSFLLLGLLFRRR